MPPLLCDLWCLLAPGDGERRKVRSDMDPEDDCLLSCCVGSGSGTCGARVCEGPLFLPLTDEDTDAVRRMVRFVWTSATLVGVVGRALRAAAAAAALSELVLGEWRVPVKAVRAADAAEELVLEAGSGYWRVRVSLGWPPGRVGSEGSGTSLQPQPFARLRRSLVHLSAMQDAEIVTTHVTACQVYAAKGINTEDRNGRRTGFGGRCFLDPNMIYYRAVHMLHIVEGCGMVSEFRR